ncbi:DUF2648 domain-containing protein [Staphylococcus simiae]|nr:SE2200 family small protein [Staphylococcus simiae]MBO1199870.1 DUF2648 domain-containing protein [Staphylococcus simiae]MBO1202131.1 DUF2648 domain-containing protein [Staphylococcus simiae]MBO1204385.1 DUF2648 domain-containing protein [Staphylococcus simiae]MBO1211925.1 DUF2648 domain-containing protein [Staphylococcus simiae]MBO1230574.1 DUF2648 domain-containing protein [Staphylococcus simiae]
MKKFAVILTIVGAGFYAFKKYQAHVNQAPNIEY